MQDWNAYGAGIRAKGPLHLASRPVVASVATLVATHCRARPLAIRQNST
jgi:hypothetical protein